MLFFLLYINLCIFACANLCIFACANLCINNKIIDIRNIDIKKYYITNSLIFAPFNEFETAKKNTNMVFGSSSLNGVNALFNTNMCNNNSIFVYESDYSLYTMDYLMTMFSVKEEIPILTSKNKHFKPFQYSIYDIFLYQYKEDELIFRKKIKKNSLHYIISNNSKYITRI